MYVVYGGGKWITLLVYVERLQRGTDKGQDIHDMFSWELEEYLFVLFKQAGH